MIIMYIPVTQKLARSGQKEVSMGKLSFWESVRVWLGGVAFDVFLWSVRMSADDYFDMIQTEGGLTKRVPDVCPECAGSGKTGSIGLPRECPYCAGTGKRR